MSTGQMIQILLLVYVGLPALTALVGVVTTPICAHLAWRDVQREKRRCFAAVGDHPCGHIPVGIFYDDNDGVRCIGCAEHAELHTKEAA